MLSDRRDDPTIRVLDLFAGCGGLTEGFHSFRPPGAAAPVFRSVGAVEWDSAAAATYSANFGPGSARSGTGPAPTVFCRDITKWDPLDELSGVEVDVVVGGPPCQGFSALNRARVGVERNRLWQEFVSVVVAVQPKVFVIENVDRFVRSPEFVDLKRRIGAGDLHNYRLVPASGDWDVAEGVDEARGLLLNSADYGAMQARRRAIVIGVRTDLPYRSLRYPSPTHDKKALHVSDEDLLVDGSAIRPWRSADDVLVGLPEPSGTELPGGRYADFGAEIGRHAGPFSMRELNITRSPEGVSRARYSAIPAGGGRKDLRGRYLCRFDDGETRILAKDGDFRNEEGVLKPFGRYRVVESGVLTEEVVEVRGASDRRGPAVTGTSRSIAELFRVSVDVDGKVRPATLEYLSTPSWDRHNTGSGDVMGRLRLGQPSVTIRTEFFKPEKGRYLHPTEDRPITHFEAAKLQGFPDDFVWHGSKTQIARQIGNAVPIPLGRAIAGAIHAFLRPERA